MGLKRIKNKLRETILKKPTQVILETTNSCNLNCPYCMVGMQNELVKKHGNAAHNLMTRPVGFMTEETFQIIRKELKQFRIRKVYLHFQGEPFLNKFTPFFAKTLKEDGFEVGVFTNGQAFNDKNIQELAKAKVDLIRFSVDGASEDTYQQNRVGGTLKRALENMKKVVAAHNGASTRIEWQFLVLRNNEHEVDSARAMADKIGVHLFLKGLRVTDHTLVPEREQYRCTCFPKPCTDTYHQIGIYWNGDVVPCCYDVDGREIMGNLHQESLQDIWRHERYRSFRNAVGNAHKHPDVEPQLCKSCLRWK